MIASGLVVLGLLLNTPQDAQQGAEQNEPGPSDTQQNTASPPAAEQAQETPFSVQEGDTTYYGATSSGVGVAVLKVASEPYLIGGMGEPVRAGGTFVIVTVAVFNSQSSAITMDNGLFDILDPNGNVYSASAQNMQVDPANDLFLAQINPGITKTGQVVFDVPTTLNLDDLQLRFRGGMTGDSANLPLKVNSTIRQMATPTESSTQTPASSY